MKRYILLLSALSILLVPLPVSAQSALNNFDPCTSSSGFAALFAGCHNLSMGSIVGNLINFIFVIAVLLSLGFIIYGGISWITSGGDKGGVEAARNRIIAAIVGLVIVVLAFYILNSLILPFLGVEGFSGLQITPIGQ